MIADGQRVLLVAKDANVVRYLTYEPAENMRVVEFFRRPFDPHALPIAPFGPAGQEPRVSQPRG